MKPDNAPSDVLKINSVLDVRVAFCVFVALLVPEWLKVAEPKNAMLALVNVPMEESNKSRK